MSLRQRIIQGGGALAFGQVVGQGGVFVRNIVIARILTRDQFGIAATFAITVALLEMISNLAVDRLLVQADDGDDERFQRTAQLFQFLRGVFNAVGLLVLAAPVALLFKVPEATWAFRALAIVPLVRGLVHLDLKRLHRAMNFGPDVRVEVLSQLVPTAIAWPLAIWLDDYSVVLWLLVVQALIQLVASHVCAERRYGWAWDPAILRRMVGFGGPLLLDGLVMFGLFQGDRLIVGAAYGMDDLGRYSVAFGLAFIPSLMVARLMTSLFLPLLSQVRNDADAFERRYRVCLQVSMMIAAAVAAGFILAGQETTVILYGEKYADVGVILAWLAVGHALRMLRVPAILAAMARADTTAVLASNVARALALAPALAAALSAASLEWIAVWGVAGEALALVVIVALAHRRHGAPAAAMAAPLTVFVGACVAAVLLHGLEPTTAPWWTGYALYVPAALCIAGAGLLLPELRGEARRLMGGRA